MEHQTSVSEKQVYCRECGESVTIHIWPGGGYMSFKDNGVAEIKEMSDGMQRIDFYCCLDCANK